MTANQYIPSLFYGLFLAFFVIGISCEEEDICERGIPVPVLDFQGIEEVVENGEVKVYYKLSVKNFFEFPDQVFTNGRLEASIQDLNGQVLSEYSDLTNKVDLLNIGYSLTTSDTTSKEVFIKVNDAVCGVEQRSEPISIFCLWGPTPELLFFGVEKDTNQQNGQIFDKYKLGLANWQAYPDRLFQKAPELASCGANVNSSRTWLEILDENDLHVYGFCGYGPSDFLQEFSFAERVTSTPPKRIYISLHDRKCDQILVSNWIDL